MNDSILNVLICIGVIIGVEGLAFTLVPHKNQTRRESWVFFSALLCGIIIVASCVFVEAKYQTACNEIMSGIKYSDASSLPYAAGLATSFDLSHPQGLGGEPREQLHAYVQKNAKSWDDCKSYNPHQKRS